MKSAVVPTTAALFARLQDTSIARMRWTRAPIALALLVATSVVGLACDNGKGATKREPPGSNAGTLAAGDPVETLYRDRCAGCHGATGHGDGSLSLTMLVKPRDFTDPSWKGAVTDEKVRTVILKGGKAIGASELMPGSPDLEKRPEVLEPLIKKVRAFSR